MSVQYLYEINRFSIKGTIAEVVAEDHEAYGSLLYE